MENNKKLNEILLERFKESFEGDENGDWYNGFFKTLDSIDAKNASIQLKHIRPSSEIGPVPSQAESNGTKHIRPSSEHIRPSIYAHSEHIKFTLLWLKSFLQGNPISVDWQSTWLKNEIDQDNWNQFRQNLRDLYQDTCKMLEQTELNDKSTSRIIGIIAHTAYHAGSIRQLALLI